jgi:hypothetical protein
VTSVSAFPTGFLFSLVVGFDIRVIPFRRLDFHAPREPRDYPAPARLLARFADGRAADSAVKPHWSPSDAAVMIYRGGDSHAMEPRSAGDDGFRRHETCWWVSPLPPPGALEFVLRLRDAPGPAGAGSVDAGPILAASGQSRRLWECA